jgi:hypothetical protein
MLPPSVFFILVLVLVAYADRKRIWDAIDRSEGLPRPNTSQLTPVDEQEFYNEQAKREWNQVPELN